MFFNLFRLRFFGLVMIAIILYYWLAISPRLYVVQLATGKIWAKHQKDISGANCGLKSLYMQKKLNLQQRRFCFPMKFDFDFFFAELKWKIFHKKTHRNQVIVKWFIAKVFWSISRVNWVIYQSLNIYISTSSILQCP